MKTEKQGTVPKAKEVPAAPTWWLGKKVECPRCAGLFTLELGDAPSRYSNFALRCPTKGCGAYIAVRPVFDRSGKIQ